MNKTLIGLFLFFGSHLLHADSLVVSAKKTIIVEKMVDQNQAIENLKFRPQFKDSYTNLSEFNYSSATEKNSFWSRLKNRFLNWLSEFLNVQIDEKPRQIWNKSLNYISVVLLLILTFYIIRAFVKKDALWFFKKSKKTFKIDHFNVEKNLEHTDFKALIASAIANNNPRLAIRYYYLALLQLLSKKEIIQWDLEKTNSDYLAEIKNEQTRESFRYLSYLYNNIWYGEFEVDPAAFQKAQQAFTDFLKPWENE
ncbi:DUF4129 domain-containing protein [Flavobacterium sp. NKUCC04_CG]|uniref:DUF4129 domain-containing protein n=1 Tax=Flavobacterium sp. NKUCC04_CG TaxID=2842121 RepID=UPI001C5BB3D8|nr:DUF4129 domain-containing protein [Flavobacterium sp. NKUCC04_CG]MBW3517990.1 DUF4129 domain-containing protein [Flavobacterium sp. NKUCC04_CG]